MSRGQDVYGLRGTRPAWYGSESSAWVPLFDERGILRVGEDESGGGGNDVGMKGPLESAVRPKDGPYSVLHGLP